MEGQGGLILFLLLPHLDLGCLHRETRSGWALQATVKSGVGAHPQAEGLVLFPAPWLPFQLPANAHSGFRWRLHVVVQALGSITQEGDPEAFPAFGLAQPSFWEPSTHAFPGPHPI